MASVESKSREDRLAEANLKDDGTAIALQDGPELERLNAAEFDPDGNKVQTLFSEETVEISVPAEIYHQYSKYSTPIWALMDLRKADTKVIAGLIAAQVAIVTQRSTAFQMRENEADHFYIEVSEEGLKGEKAERGAVYSFTKCLGLVKKLRSKTISDEEMVYLTKHKESFKRDKAEADAMGEF